MKIENRSLKFLFSRLSYMYRTLDEELFFTQKVLLKKRYTNKEIQLYQYFFKKTEIYPENIILINNFFFFFVKNKDYFKAKVSLRDIRSEIGEHKIQIIRLEKTLLKLILSFFPDPYVHDIKLAIEEDIETKIINIGLLSFEERGIAIGRSGDYIKAINQIFEKHVIFEQYATFERYSIPIKIQCKTLGIFE